MIVGKTDEGMLYGIRRNCSAVAYCALSIKCGTRDEEGFSSGIAHFTEHTIFKGTGHKSAATINSYLDRLGGELNAFTTKEEIVIHATVLKEDLSKAVSLLMELATEATFPEKEIEIEKGVVLDEIASYKDSPADDVYDRFEEMLFAGHPLGRPILGTPSSVRKISSKELLEFVKKNFTPDRMALTIVADIDEQKALKLVKCPLQMNPEIRRDTECTPVERVHFDKTIDKRNHEVNAVIGGLAPSLYEERERIAAVLLANILAGPGSNSILNRELREKRGLVYGVESSYTQYKEYGIFAINLGCDKSNLDKCLSIIQHELTRIQETGFTSGRLKAAKKQLIGQLAIGSANGESQCLAMGKSLLAFGTISTDEEDRAKIESVTADELQQVAKRILAPENLSKLVYL
ncbi:MAG: insulinase family protein [Bacteroidales bacterium]|nr:insulinase family protein [Bacteroidales bacterium]